MWVEGTLAIEGTGNQFNDIHAVNGLQHDWMNGVNRLGPNGELVEAWTTFEDLREPTLDIETNIIGNPAITRLGINQFLQWGNFSMDLFRQAIDGVAKSNRYMPPGCTSDPNCRGFAVVELTGNTNLAIPHEPGVVDDDVIFILSDNSMLQTQSTNASQTGGFYRNTEPNPNADPPVRGSSTMIYLRGQQARLNNFVVDGLFRGLVYASENNNPTIANQIQATPSADFRGAIYSMGDASLMLHNIAAPNGTTGHFNITYDADIVNNFSGLIDGSSGGGGPGTIVMSPNFTPRAYYFY
jgi:hypothetical protein